MEETQIEDTTEVGWVDARPANVCPKCHKDKISMLSCVSMDSNPPIITTSYRCKDCNEEFSKTS